MVTWPIGKKRREAQMLHELEKQAYWEEHMHKCIEREKRIRSLENVVITPESMEQYSRRVGYKVEQIVLPGFEKGVSADVTYEKSDGTHRQLVHISDYEFCMKEGICAIVNATLDKRESYCAYYGIPVRRKK
jgi:hypothetical protein